MGLLQLLKSQFLCLLIMCYVFLVSGLVVNLLQLCTLPLWLINKQLARRINIRLAYCISSQTPPAPILLTLFPVLSTPQLAAHLKPRWFLPVKREFFLSTVSKVQAQDGDCAKLVAALEWWSGTECTLYTDPKSYPLYGNENAIVVLNHSFEIDFLCGWTFCERFGVLGSSKVLAKNELAYMPVIGWMWYFLEIVFCKRKWEEDRTTVTQSLQKLHDYPERFWFLLFCEGTRFTPKKHQVSMQVAESKGLPKLKHHLLPRTKGFWVTVQNLRGTAAAVYDSTLNFRNNEAPTLLGVLTGKKYHADLYVRRIPLESIPEDEAECSAWLHKLYQEKDGFQEQYLQTGRFPGPIMIPPRRPWSLINWIFWCCVMLYPLGLLLVRLVSSGSLFTIVSTVAVCSAVSVGIRWMIGQTEINRSSNYGIKESLLNNN